MAPAAEPDLSRPVFATQLSDRVAGLLAGGAARVVVRIEREGAVLLETDHGTREALQPEAHQVVDDPATLMALHDLAAAWPAARVILVLPPECVGRRW